jgi:uncharacterized protein (DUF4415 family)
MSKQVRRGRPPLPVTKQQITLRLTRATIDKFRKAYVQGWQPQISAALDRAARRIK